MENSSQDDNNTLSNYITWADCDILNDDELQSTPLSTSQNHLPKNSRNNPQFPSNLNNKIPIEIIPEIPCIESNTNQYNSNTKNEFLLTEDPSNFNSFISGSLNLNNTKQDQELFNFSYTHNEKYLSPLITEERWVQSTRTVHSGLKKTTKTSKVLLELNNHHTRNQDTNSIIVDEFKKQFVTLTNELNEAKAEKQNLQNQWYEYQYQTVSDVGELTNIKLAEARKSNKAWKDLNTNLHVQYNSIQKSMEIKKKSNSVFLKKIMEIKQKYKSDIINLKNETWLKEEKIKKYEIKSEQIKSEYDKDNNAYLESKKINDELKRSISAIKGWIETTTKQQEIASIEKPAQEIDSNDIVCREGEDNIKAITLWSSSVDIDNKVLHVYRTRLVDLEQEIKQCTLYLTTLNQEIENVKSETESVSHTKEQAMNDLKKIEQQYQMLKDKEDEIKIRNKEIKELLNKEEKYDWVMKEIKKMLNGKNEIILLKKEMNILLFRLASLKKDEVELWKNMKGEINSGKIKEMKEQENELMNEINQIINNLNKNNYIGVSDNKGRSRNNKPV